MVEDAKTKKRKDLKTKSREYTGYDDDEFVIPGAARSVLAKYDEDIEGVQETGFRLGGGVMGSSSQAARAGRGGGAAVINKPLLSIDYASE
jgi:U4/U6.U5 tri-snRNP-associated protein 1